MKKILDYLPQRFESIFDKFGNASAKETNTLRWLFCGLFILTALWTMDDESAAIFIYPTMALLWLLAASVFGLRAKENLSLDSKLSVWIDLTIISSGILLSAWLRVLNTKGLIIFMCYFAVIALAARKQNRLLILQISLFVFVFNVLVNLTVIGSIHLPRLLSLVAISWVAYLLTQRPTKELVEGAGEAVKEAYALGASDKAVEMLTAINQHFFPPAQYDLPGLYVVHKHSAGTTLSGDFHLTVETAQGPMVVLGDLSGNGLSSALAARQLQNEIAQLTTHRHELPEIARALNKSLCRQGRVASCILARWESDQLQFINAGHLPAIRISKRELHTLPVNAPSLGSSCEVQFHLVQETFLKGDLLLLYTDGAYEGLAKNPVDGAAEIHKLADQFSSGEVNTICHRVFDCGQPEFARAQDDSTVVVVRRQEYSEEATG